MKNIVLSLTALLFIFVSHAQEKVKWNFSAKKIADKTYEVHLTPTVQSPWHIYSQTSPDDGTMPTTFRFNNNPLLSFSGNVKEIGKITSKYEESFGVTVKYFEGKVDFVQVVQLKTNVKTNLSGTVEFMICNDEQCYPPATVNFSVLLQ